MSNGLGYVIEIGGDAAGLVVKEDNKFRFYAAQKRFSGLERKLYRSPAEAENACRQVEHAADRAGARERRRSAHMPFGWPALAV